MQCESCLHKLPAAEWCNTDICTNLERSRIVFTKELSTAAQVVNPTEYGNVLNLCMLRSIVRMGPVYLLLR